MTMALQNCSHAVITVGKNGVEPGVNRLHTHTHTLREGNNEPTTNKPPVVDTRHGRAEVAEHKSPDTSSGHSIQRQV